MNFWSNVLIAVLSVIHPAIAFAGSIVKYLTSAPEKLGFCFLLNVVRQIIPGGFLKDIAFGVLSDLVLVDTFSSAIKKIMPFSNIVLKCDSCDVYTHYYIRKDERILCRKCLEDNLGDEIRMDDKIYIRRNFIYRAKKQIEAKNLTIKSPVPLGVKTVKTIRTKKSRNSHISKPKDWNIHE